MVKRLLMSLVVALVAAAVPASANTITGLLATPYALEATVSWQTNWSCSLNPGPPTIIGSDSTVSWGLTSTYSETYSDANTDVLHTVTITGLTPNTTYHYKVSSRDGCGVVVTSTDQTFATLPAPAITSTSYTPTPGTHCSSARGVTYAPIGSNPVLDPNSAAWSADVVRQIRAYYGNAQVHIWDHTAQVYFVDANAPTQVVATAPQSWNGNQVYQPLQDKFNAVPVPDDFAPAAGSDRQAVIFQPSTGKLWEMWYVQRTPNTVVRSDGAVVPQFQINWGAMVNNAGQYPGYFPRQQDALYSVYASGMMYLCNLATIAELQAGVINHALTLVLPETVGEGIWAWPAQATDGPTATCGPSGYSSAPGCIPQGTIFTFPATLNLDTCCGLTSFGKTIAKAVQKYGMVVSDTSGAVGIYAENPGTRYGTDPYYKQGGLLGCPPGFPDASDVCQPISCATAADTCYGSNGAFKNFPWDQLVALKVSQPLIQWSNPQINACDAAGTLCPPGVN